MPTDDPNDTPATYQLGDWNYYELSSVASAPPWGPVGFTYDVAEPPREDETEPIIVAAAPQDQ